MKTIRFRRIISVVLAFMLVLPCAIFAQDEESEDTYQIVASISDDREGITVTGYSSRYLSGDSLLASEMVLMINKYMDNLTAFHSIGMYRLLIDCMEAYAESKEAWVKLVNEHFETYDIQGNDLKRFAVDTDTCLADLTPGVSYTMSMMNKVEGDHKYGATYTVTLTLYRNGDVMPVTDPATSGVDRLMTAEHIAYMQGDDKGNFRPKAPLPRREAAQVFYNLLKDKNVDAPAAFEDVADDVWYAEAVNTIAALGIIEGDGQGHFFPDRNITRAQFVTMVARLANKIDGLCTFTDVDEEHWAYSYIATAEAYRWISSAETDEFRPDEDITRAEMVVIMNKVLGRMADKEAIDDDWNSLKYFPDVIQGRCREYFDIIEATNSHDYEYIAGSERWK